MRHANVGRFVRFRGGKMALPDMNHTNEINGLSLNCRECRVFIPGETPEKGRNSDVESFYSQRAEPTVRKPFNSLDLNDARL
jgi:hypothetical protein